MNTREMRVALSMTQEEFSREVGVSLRTVAGWEDKNKPSQPSRLASEKLVAIKRRIDNGKNI